MRITAKELIDKLNKDPEYKKNIAKKNAQFKMIQTVLRKDEKILLKEIKAVGISIKSVWDFVNNNNRHEFLRSGAPENYSEAYPVLVKHLRITHHPKTREGIIRALTEKDAYEVAGQVLLDEFNTEIDSDLKWVLANALKVVLPLEERKLYPEIAKVVKGDYSGFHKNDI